MSHWLPCVGETDAAERAEASAADADEVMYQIRVGAAAPIRTRFRDLPHPPEAPLRCAGQGCAGRHSAN